jgi:hypothetical protein
LEAGSSAEAQFAVRPELIADFQMDYIVYEKIWAEITTGIGLIIIIIETGVVLIVMIYLKFIEGGKGKCHGIIEMESDIGIGASQKVIAC